MTATSVVDSEPRAATEAASTAKPSARPGTLRAGRGEPLVLLHGVTGTSRMWSRVLPLLAPHHDVIAPTALGHHNGPPATVRPTRIAHIVDDLERYLDQLGFDRVHFAGNSMGGWIALELARRGRAKTVLALSPAGAWLPEHQLHATNKLRAVAARSRMSRWMLPLLARSKGFRRFALRDSATHGDLVPREDLIDLADGLLGCDVYEDLFDTDEALTAFTATCPITLAWSEDDRIFPLDVVSPYARTLVRGAEFMVLPEVGHVPMLEAPELIARTILQSSARAPS